MLNDLLPFHFLHILTILFIFAHISLQVTSEERDSLVLQSETEK